MTEKHRQNDHAAHEEKFRRTLEIADVLGAGNIRLFSYYLPENADPADYRGEVIDRLGSLIHYAEGSSIRLCHENEKGIYGDNAARCLELLEALPRLGGVFDPANFVQCGQDTLEAWELLKRRIVYLHIKDALADGTVVPAGDGEGHVAEILRAYIAQGGTAVTIEPHLQEFTGLQGLERPGEDRKIGLRVHYSSHDESFDAACAALRNILKTL